LWCYICWTKRKLNTRVSEHKNDINKRTGKHSVITEHRLEKNHEFDWDNPEILDREKYYCRRLISEMINIKLQKNTLNIQSDTELITDLCRNFEQNIITMYSSVFYYNLFAQIDHNLCRCIILSFLNVYIIKCIHLMRHPNRFLMYDLIIINSFEQETLTRTLTL